MRLRDDSILITGGGSGLGLGMARAFLERGNRVAICGRREEKLREAKELHPDLVVHACDVSHEDGRRSLQAALEAEGFETNVLVNNAARMSVYALDRPSAEDSARMHEDVEINLVAVMELVSLFLPGLLSRPNAAIVNVSSPAGLVPVTRVPVYSATKAALHAYTVSLRDQLQRRAGAGVEVVEIYPPGVATEMTEDVRRKQIGVDEFVTALMPRLERGDEEIWIGEGRVLPWLNRLAPKLTLRLVNQGVEAEGATRD